jgi:amino acid adenylation domain-containing protein
VNLENIEDIYPLSPMQEGMLFHTLYSQVSGIYFTQFYYTLKGRLDEARLRRAAQQVIDRHPTLRTGVIWEGLDKPVQVVYRRVTLPFKRLDWRELSAREQQTSLDQYLQADRKRGFELSKAPLLRLALFQAGEESFHLVWSCHHLLMDGWSVVLLVKEVFACYEAYSRGQEPVLEPVCPYRNYIAWLQRQDMLKAEAYWRRTLEGFTAATSLGADRRLSATAQTEAVYDEHRTSVGAETTAALQSIARQHQLTLNTIVQGAWAVLLSLYSGSDDVIFGATVSGRPPELEAVESIIGLFINTLPVRVRVTADESLLGWLKRLQQQQAELREYEYTPLVEIQRWSEVQRGQPLFESILAFENYLSDRKPRDGKPDLEQSAGHVVERNSYPVALVVGPGTELHLRIVYDCQRFDAETISRTLTHLRALLESIAERPEQRLAELSPLSERERQRFLIEWNETSADYPKDLCIHQLFESQVEATPDAVAAEFEDERLTYRELNERANRLAHRLIALGIGPGARVGLCLEHSLETLVAIFGVLKAGGVYVPLEPAHPQAKLAFVISDAEISVLLTQTRHMERLRATAADILCLDAGAESEAAAAGENPRGGVAASDLAYVIYTSGSTGQPKGVKIQHAALVNYIWWAKQVYLKGESLAFPLYSSLAFDLTVTSIFTPLVTGNKVVIYRNDSRESPIFEVIRDNRVGVLKLTPSHLSVIKEIDNSRSAVKRLIVGGEAFETRLASEIQRSFAGRVEIYNEYGPTEATVGCMIHRYDAERDTRTMVPIGSPAANSQIYVLDESLNPVAENVVGELYIAGDGLAEGYLNREELTRERFIANPFVPGQRMYRTGDLARRLTEGGLELLGRSDEQVKFHGHRVELNEIRSRLNEHPQVRDSVVVVSRDNNANDVMVAYYVARQEIESKQLRGFLAESIVEETIPNLFVHLKKLPLTLNGKVNLQALPSLADIKQTQNRACGAPRTAIEEMLAGIWSGVLGVEQVGVDDNFFELGGHSLLATQLISRVREAFNVEVQLSTLFAAATVAEFAATVEELRLRQQQQVAPPPISRVARLADGLPLSYAQQQLWFLDQLDPGNTSYNISKAIRLQGRLDIAVLEQTLTEVVRRHETLRTTFPARNGHPVQVVSPASEVKLEIENLSGLAADEREAEARTLAHEEARRPFNLASDPTLRTRLLRLAEDDYVLLFTMHHIVSDAWSMGVLVREVTTLYEAFLKGQPSPLSALPIQYGDFAHWQRQWLEGEVGEAHVAYWKHRLSRLTAMEEFPTDRLRPAVQSYQGAYHTQLFARATTDALKRLSNREGVTLFMTLLAAFNVVMGHYSRRDEMAVGIDVAGRNRAETEGLIGLFVNQLVLLVRQSEQQSFSELLAQVRADALAAYAHQDLPFDRLVEALNPARRLSHNPLFQVMFGFQNTLTSTLQLPGLKLSGMDAASEKSVFELSLYMTEKEEGLSGTWAYRTELFEPSTIARWSEHFELVVNEIIKNPDVSLHSLRETLAVLDREKEAHRREEFKEARRRKLKHLSARLIARETAPQDSPQL